MSDWVHRETTNTHDLPRAEVLLANMNPYGPPITAEERAVLDAAREYDRLDGDVDAHNLLMYAVQAWKESLLNARPVCYCGTGREHERGAG